MDRYNQSILPRVVNKNLNNVYNNNNHNHYLVPNESILNCDNNKLQTILRELKKKEFSKKIRKNYTNTTINKNIHNNNNESTSTKTSPTLPTIKINNDYIVPISNNGTTIYYNNSSSYLNKNNNYLKNIYSNNNNNNNINNEKQQQQNIIKVNKTPSFSSSSSSLLRNKSLPPLPLSKKIISIQNDDCVVPSTVYTEIGEHYLVPKRSFCRLPSFVQVSSNQINSLSSLDLPPIKF